MKRKRFSLLETVAQRLIEGTLSRFLGGRLELQEVATRLARALEDSHTAGEVATTYHVHLNPADYDALREQHSELTQRLTQYLVQLAQQTNITLPEEPHVTLLPDDEIEQHQLQIQAERDETRVQATQKYDFRGLDDTVEVTRAIRNIDAFLIIDGGRHVALKQPLTTLGRRVDNDIILDSSAVSRKHAQIRWRYNRFVVYDLGSRAGTAVNGEPVTEYALQPGDVIILGDVSLIYGEGYTQHRRRTRPTRPDEVAGNTLALPKRELDELREDIESE